jgi:hypothetical protein
MEQIWPGFCCEGFNFVVMERDDGFGYGICLNPDCPHGEVQGFQLEDNEEFELEEEYAGWFS